MSSVFLTISLCILYVKLNANKGAIFEHIGYRYGWLLFACMLVAAGDAGTFIRGSSYWAGLWAG
jgi:hypothetical protein